MTIEMTRARRSLADCELSLEKFLLKPIGDEFRLTLVTCFALLRAVGHVAKHEAEEVGISSKSDAIWNQVKNDDLFVHFISAFRNNVLKEYRSPVKWASITSQDNHRMEYLISEGFYDGRDVRDLIRDSIQWWSIFLDRLEKTP